MTEPTLERRKKQFLYFEDPEDRRQRRRQWQDIYPAIAAGVNVAVRVSGENFIHRSHSIQEQVRQWKYRTGIPVIVHREGGPKNKWRLVWIIPL